MRPKTFSYSPVTASATGFASNVTGATWTLTTTVTTDSLAHKVLITNDAAVDHSAKTAILIGTDQDGNYQTETMFLPQASVTSTSTLYYKTLTSITPSATIGGDTMDIGWEAASISPSYMLSHTDVTPGGVSVAAVITGTINYDVQHTFEDLFGGATTNQTATWFDHADLAAETTSKDGNYAFPIIACRFMVNTVTNGATIKFTVMEGNR